jgi:hypothetical protein
MRFSRLFTAGVFFLVSALLVDCKNIVNPPTLKKTDTALIAAIIYKF